MVDSQLQIHQLPFGSWLTQIGTVGVPEAMFNLSRTKHLAT